MSIDQGKRRWNGWGLVSHAGALESREEVWTWLAGELGMPSLLATPARRLEDITLPPVRLAPEERDGLVSILGAEQVRDDGETRASHALGRSYHDLLRLRAGDLSSAPDVVVFPRGSDEVLAILMLAQARGLAVVPYGGGTSVVGGVTADKGTAKAVITLDLGNMDRVIEIDPVSCRARVEAGIAGPTLEKVLAAEGLTLGHYPQSFEFSTLGGWISHRGAGQQSERYGGPADWLAAVKLVTPRGALATEEFAASAAGPRLTDLVIGAEGQFGIVTEAILRLRPAPAARDYRGYLFADFQSGIAAIREAMQAGVNATTLRLTDPDETRVMAVLSQSRARPGLGNWLRRRLANPALGNGALLIAGFEGPADEIAFGQKRVAAITGRLGTNALGSRVGTQWYQNRFHVPYLRDPLLDRGVGIDSFETATTWAKLDELYTATRTALEKAIRETAPRPDAQGIAMCHVSHASRDGAGLTFTAIFPRTLDSELAQWQAIKKAVTDAIVAHGGTLSHHHGVGQDHLPWMAAEKGELGLEVLRAIKHTLDPKAVLNPGKLIPD